MSVIGYERAGYRCNERANHREGFDRAYRRMLRRERAHSAMIGLAVLGVMALSVVLPLAYVALSTR